MLELLEPIAGINQKLKNKFLSAYSAVLYLNLFLVPSSDVGNGPASLLLDALLVVVGQKCEQTWQSLVVDNKL